MNFDLPLKELETYTGSSPKPKDFAAYWERALAELDQQSLDYELVPATFQTSLVDCYDLYFTGVGGARIHCKLAQPKQTDEAGPGIVMFHGYSCDSGDWVEKAMYAAHGTTVLAMDCRGQGGLSEDPLVVKGSTLRGHIIRGVEDPNPDHLYFRNVFLDTVQAARILMSMPHVDETRIGAHGASQGGALTVACAALEPRIKLALPVYPFLSDYRRAWEMDMNNTAYEEIAWYFRQLDPTHEREEAIFNRLGYIDIQNLADRIQAKVFWVTAMIDQVCPPSTQFAAYNKIQSEKQMVLYHEYGHEYLLNLPDKAFQFFSNL